MSTFRIGLDIEGLEDCDMTLEKLQPIVNEVVAMMLERSAALPEDKKRHFPAFLAAFGAQCIREAKRIEQFRQSEEENREG